MKKLSKCSIFCIVSHTEVLDQNRAKDSSSLHTNKQTTECRIYHRRCRCCIPLVDIKKRRTGTRESRNSANGASVIHQWKIRPSCHCAAGINKLRKIRRGELEEPENSTSTRATIAKQTSSSSRFNVHLSPPRSFLPSNERFRDRLSRDEWPETFLETRGDQSVFDLVPKLWIPRLVSHISLETLANTSREARFLQSREIEDEKRKWMFLQSCENYQNLTNSAI